MLGRLEHLMKVERTLQEYTDNGWVEISASVSDISTYVATTDDVYSIIDAY